MGLSEFHHWLLSRSHCLLREGGSVFLVGVASTLHLNTLVIRRAQGSHGSMSVSLFLFCSGSQGLRLTDHPKAQD